MEGNCAPDASGGAPGASRARFLLIWRSGQEREEARHEGEDAGQTSGQTRHPLMSLAMSSAMSPLCCCGWFVKGSRAFGQGGRGPKSISEVPLNPAPGKIFSLILALRGFLARCSLINNPHGPGGTWTHCCLGLAKPWNFNPRCSQQWVLFALHCGPSSCGHM